MHWVAGAVLLVLLLAALWLDGRRLDRADEAGRAAMQEARRAQAEHRPQRVDIRLNDWGPSYGADRWRWTIFDAEPDYDSPVVEGTLTPYGTGNEASEDEAIRAGIAVVAELEQRYGKLEVLVNNVPMNR